MDARARPPCGAGLRALAACARPPRRAGATGPRRPPRPGRPRELARPARPLRRGRPRAPALGDWRMKIRGTESNLRGSSLRMLAEAATTTTTALRRGVDGRPTSPALRPSGGRPPSSARQPCSGPPSLACAAPQDIWRHIHSITPLRDAARAACLSHAFLRSWRCHPNLTLSRDALASKAHACAGITYKIDCILRNHSGCLKVLNLDLQGISCRYLDGWLRVAVTPGIEELTLLPFKRKYNVPCSLLSDGVRNSIRYLEIGYCTFRPTAELGPLRSLTSLHLRTVRITGDELECLLSNALALEQLLLFDCKELIYLKIPCVLQQLGCLEIIACWWLQVIESKAPNLSSFYLTGKVSNVSLGDTLHMKNLILDRSNVVCYARTELPCIMPNLETLVLSSEDEVVSTTMLPSKFLFLKHLSIKLISAFSFSRSFDYFSLVSFLDASPSLETLTLDVTQELMKHESAVGGSSNRREMPEHRHCCLKSVKITGFSSAKGLVELACYILKNAVSLESMTRDTIFGPRRSGNDHTLCLPKSCGVLKEAPTLSQLSGNTLRI